MDRIELSQLKKTIRYAYNTSPYYHKLFKENGLRPSDIKKFSDMTKIPYTKTEDLQNDPKSFFSVPENQFIRVFTTAGTTGKPKKAYFTKEDLDRIVESTATGVKLMSEEELLQGVQKIAGDFYSVKSSLRRSFNGHNLNPLKPLITFANSMGLRSFYKKEKLDI